MSSGCQVKSWQLLKKVANFYLYKRNTTAKQAQIALANPLIR
jgi:hypothetical protein